MPNFAEILAGHPGLRPGASKAELLVFEQHHSITLTPILREFYLYTDGLDIEDGGSGICPLTTPTLKYGCLNILSTSNYDLWVNLQGVLQDYIWLQDLYSPSAIRYSFRSLATCLTACLRSNGPGWPDWDETPWELDTREFLPHETAYAEHLFTQWLQTDDDWQYLLDKRPYQRTADLCIALQFATESQLKERLRLKLDADPTVRGAFAYQLSRLANRWAQEFLATWRLEVADYEDELRTFSEQCAAALQVAGIPAYAKWKKVFLEGRAEPLDIQAVFSRRHEPDFFDELTKHIQETL